MRFGEGVSAERFQLLEGLAGDGGAHSACLRSRQKASAESLQLFAGALVAQRPPQQFSLAGCKAGKVACHFEHLFLKENHAQRLAQSRFEQRVQVCHRLTLFAPPQIGVHHVCLQRPGPNQCHLHGQVGEGARLEARNQRGLRAAFHLEDPDGLGAAEHIEHGRVIESERRQIRRRVN